MRSHENLIVEFTDYINWFEERIVNSFQKNPLTENAAVATALISLYICFPYEQCRYVPQEEGIDISIINSETQRFEFLEISGVRNQTDFLNRIRDKIEQYTRSKHKSDDGWVIVSCFDIMKNRLHRMPKK